MFADTPLPHLPRILLTRSYWKFHAGAVKEKLAILFSDQSLGEQGQCAAGVKNEPGGCFSSFHRIGHWLCFTALLSLSTWIR